MRGLFAAVAAFFALTMAAHAGQCPALMHEVDAKLETAQVSDEERARIVELREQGEAQHEAGDHAASVASLQEALALLE